MTGFKRRLHEINWCEPKAKASESSDPKKKAKKSVAPERLKHILG